MNKKMNNIGFMMAEVVVMAAIILGVITSIYTSYSKVFTRYYTVLNYYNVDGIYKLASYRDEMINSSENDNINSILNIVSTSNMVVFTKTSNYPGLCIFKTDALNSLVNESNSAFNTGYYIDPNNGFYINPAYREYIKYVNDSVDFENNYVMVLEYDCFDNPEKGCYSYLELED